MKFRLYRIISLLLSLLITLSVFPVTALAEGGAYEITAPENEYSLSKITITGADVKEHNLTQTDVSRDDGHTYKQYTYQITLAPGTATGTVINAAFDFPGVTANWPGVSPKTWTDVGKNNTSLTELLNKKDPIFATIKSLSESAESSGYIYAKKSSMKDDKYEAKYVFCYSVAPYEDGPKENITAIQLHTQPTKTTYYAGEYFDPSGMTLTATLASGSTSDPFHECTWTPDGPLSVDDTTIQISYGGQTTTVDITVKAGNALADAEILDETGQFMFKPYLLDESIEEPQQPGLGIPMEKGNGKIVALYGADTVKVQLTLANGESEVYINDKSTPEQKDETDATKCILELPHSNGGTTTKITLRKDGESDKEYTFICYSQGSGRPNAVTGYLNIGSQYTNSGNIYNRMIGLSAVSTLMGGRSGNGGGTGTTLESGLYSLGNFGGYITYYYKDAIKDDPKNPYGVEFTVPGNSVDGTYAFAEPGQVYVSEDGTKWYALAGAVHYEDFVDWDYSVTYKNVSGRTTIVAKDGTTTTSYLFPTEERYPFFDWAGLANKNEITLTGIHLDMDATDDWFPEFGYADRGGTLRTHGLNPYVVSRPSSLDGFDLAWAVDENGQPVTFENGIHYIKVQAMCSVIRASTGEKSPEITGVALMDANATDVGKTEAPTAVKIAGKTVDFGGSNVANISIAPGAFIVNVDAPEDAHVFINSTAAKSRTYAQIPDHKMIRVIVQEGDKEPWIGYINLTEDENGETTASTTVTFDAAGGVLDGSSTRVYMAGMTEEELTFPTPTWEKRTFLGWFDENGKQYTKYEEGMPAALTLTAKWEYILDEGEASTINVSFRLIGSTKSTADVDLEKGEAGYNGAEYLNWIPTKTYTMPAGSTVLDLMTTAAGRAGIKFYNPSGNYITGVYAPAVLGGYLLQEFTNGPRSGWMYTINDKHALNGVEYETLSDGMEVIFHYVNDYAYEVSDWGDIGGESFPSLGDGEFFDRWLDAADIPPSEDMVKPTTPKTDIEVETTPKVDGTIDVTVKVDGKEVDHVAGGVKVEIPNVGDGQVVVIIDADGKETVVQKSLVENGKAYAILDGSCTIAIRDNSKEFTDVAVDSWYAEAVQFAASHGLFSGVSDTEFAPNAAMTRSMLATVLWRLEDEVKAAGGSYFSDVAEGQWYSEGVAWASEKGIVTGYGDGKFGPDDSITREQLATMLYRYAKTIGMDTKTSANLSSFHDGGKVSDWASEAMRWAVGSGIITGRTNGDLDPSGSATRAEVAIMLQRLVKLMVK